MTTRNDVTQDRLASRHSEEYREKFETVFSGDKEVCSFCGSSSIKVVYSTPKQKTCLNCGKKLE